MEKNTSQKVQLTSSNLSEEKLAELRRILPEAFSEDKIDWEKLRTVLGDDVDARIEKFGFTWAGKGSAIKNVLIPSKATLAPAKDEGVMFDESENIFIEGDNLEVLKLLQKAYFEKVKMIYIDPPYNTGGDFVYKDNFASPVKNYLEQTGQIDSEGNKLQTNKETNGRYHSDWLSMMYPRLKLAWNLLRDDGAIFVSIDDNEVHHLRMVMNEVFGEENFVSQIVWQKKYAASNDNKYISELHEYVVCYAKSKQDWKPNLFERPQELNEKYGNPDNDPRGSWYPTNLSVKTFSEKNYYEIISPAGIKFLPPPSRCWVVSEEKYKELLNDNRIWFGKEGKSRPYQKTYLSEVQQGIVPTSLWLHQDAGHTIQAKSEIRELFSDTTELFDTPKPVKLIQRIINLSCDSQKKDDIILDFFAGSATTAHAVMKQNVEDGGTRKFLLVQLPEALKNPTGNYKTISDIAIERVRRAAKKLGDKSGFKVFKLTDSNYPENTFDFDSEKPEEENKKAFENYLTKAKQSKLIDDVDELGIVYENIVKEGFSLNSQVNEGKIAKNKIYTVADGERQLLLCLDKEIGKETVSELTSKNNKSKTFICFDNALDDTAKANLGLNLELKTI